MELQACYLCGDKKTKIECFNCGEPACNDCRTKCKRCDEWFCTNCKDDSTSYCESCQDEVDSELEYDDDVVIGDEEKSQQYLIEDMEFSVRIFNCLKRAGINSLYDICNYTKKMLKEIKNLNDVSVSIVIAKMTENGLNLKELVADENIDLKDNYNFAIIEKIEKTFGEISNDGGKNLLMLNLIKWQKEPKYDLRNWYTEKGSDVLQAGKGVTFSYEQLITLSDLLNSIRKK